LGIAARNQEKEIAMDNWLDKFEAFLDAMYAEYVEAYKQTRDPRDAGHAQGLMRARVEFERLRSDQSDKSKEVANAPN